MKAAVLYADNDLRYEEYPTPKAGAGEVRVRVMASGICGSDIPRVLHGGAHFYPIVLGHEFSGIIDQVGEGVTGLSAGDTVTGAPLVPCMKCSDCQSGDFSLCRKYSFIGSRRQGSFAEYVVIPAQNAVKYDPAIPFVQAAFFEPSTVALHGLLHSGYAGGEYVAVIGGGTIGLFTAQWAKILGAKKVVVFDIVPERLDLALRLGADYAINTLEHDFMEQAMSICQGAGYREVYETAGSPETIKIGFRLAANKANLCCIGTPHRDVSFSPALWELMNRREFRLTGSWMSYSAPFPGREWELTAHFFSTGQLRFDPELIYRTYPLSHAAEAFALFANPADVKGKVMLLCE